MHLTPNPSQQGRSSGPKCSRFFVRAPNILPHVTDKDFSGGRMFWTLSHKAIVNLQTRSPARGMNEAAYIDGKKSFRDIKDIYPDGRTARVCFPCEVARCEERSEWKAKSRDWSTRRSKHSGELPSCSLQPSPQLSHACSRKLSRKYASLEIYFAGCHPTALKKQQQQQKNRSTKFLEVVHATLSSLLRKPPFPR